MPPLSELLTLGVTTLTVAQKIMALIRDYEAGQLTDRESDSAIETLQGQLELDIGHIRAILRTGSK